PQLARAGSDLCFHLFRKHKESKKLSELVPELESELREREHLITITSSDFFVPWNFLYTHPDPKEKLRLDGANFQKEGFWGYRHSTEHNIARPPQNYLLTPTRDGRLPIGVNVDKNLDKNEDGTDRGTWIARQRKFFSEHPRLDVTVREETQPLFDDLAKP